MIRQKEAEIFNIFKHAISGQIVNNNAADKSQLSAVSDFSRIDIWFIFVDILILNTSN